MIFSKLNLDKICHVMLQICPPNLSDVATLPWEIQKVIFNSIIHIYFWLFMVSQKKQSVIHLTAPPESVTTLGCELQNFLIWLKVCCVLSNIGGSEKSQLWAVIGDSEKKPVVMSGNWNVTASVQSDHLLHSAGFKCEEALGGIIIIYRPLPTLKCYNLHALTIVIITKYIYIYFYTL